MKGKVQKVVIQIFTIPKIVEYFMDGITHRPSEIIENSWVGVIFYEWLVIKNEMVIIE